MKIGIDISFTKLNNAGLGNYVRGLLEGFSQIPSSIEFFHFDVNQTRNNLQPKTIRTRLDTLYRDLIWMNLVLPFKVKFHHLDLLHMPVFSAPLTKTLPTVITIHDMIWFDHPEYFPVWQRIFMKLIIPITARSANAVIAISENTRQDIIHKLGIAPQKIFVTPLGVSCEFSKINDDYVELCKQKYKLSKYFLMVGSVEPRKNLPRLLAAYSKIKDDFPEIKLVHVGSASWKNSEIFAMIEKLGLENSVHFLWNIPKVDLIALYNGAKFLVYPSLYEGFGLPVLEAMACGCPVITSDISSIPEVVGDAALMVDPYDVDMIADALRQFLTNESILVEYSCKGEQQAKKFSWKKCAENTLDVYKTVLRV